MEEGTDPVGTIVWTPTDAVIDLVGGPDAIDSCWTVLRFAAPPDFEAPADANGDNAYDVTLAVTLGALATQQERTTWLRSSRWR